jgi:hypothetical protein
MKPMDQNRFQHMVLAILTLIAVRAGLSEAETIAKAEELMAKAEQREKVADGDN